MIVPYGCDIVSEVALQRVTELAQVQVAVHAAELLGGLAHAGGAPSQCHLPVAPRNLSSFFGH